jgi:hypothetical protein
VATAIFQPEFCDVNTWRDVQKRNAGVRKIGFGLITDETWLPAVLVQAGFFASNGQVKKNQPKLWRDVVPNEVVELSWASIRIVHADFTLDGESSDHIEGLDRERT